MTGKVWTLMAAELRNLKRWYWEREFKVIWDFVKLWTLLYWSYLRPTETKVVEFAAEDSWRGASNNLKVIVPAALSHVCRNSRWSWESATKQLHDNVGEVVRSWRSSWDKVRNDNNRWRRCVVDWTDSYAEHQSGSCRRSTDICESRRVVRLQACRPFPPL